METNIQILNADNYLSVEYTDNQIIENQNQAYYITAGMDEIKDIYNDLRESLKGIQNDVEEISNQIEYLQQHDHPLKEFDMIVERYYRYNSNMMLDDILKHPRVMEKKPSRDKYKKDMRQLQINLKIANDDYKQVLEEKGIEYDKLRDKFALYSAVLGTNETLEPLF